jgi:hypothetical protein
MKRKQIQKAFVVTSSTYVQEILEKKREISIVLLFSGACKEGQLAGLATPFRTLHDT